MHFCAKRGRLGSFNVLLIYKITSTITRISLNLHSKSEAACLFIRENVILLKLTLFTLLAYSGKSIHHSHNIARNF